MKNFLHRKATSPVCRGDGLCNRRNNQSFVGINRPYRSIHEHEAFDMTHMTTLDELKQHITLLASVEESDAPFISCYLNLENGQAGWRDNT